MLKFESVYWATKDEQSVFEKFEKLGFSLQDSKRDSQTKAVYFGPEAIEFFSPKKSLVSLTDLAQIDEFIRSGDGLYGLTLESDFIAEDYNRLQKIHSLEKPRKALDTSDDKPLWYGFNIIPREPLGLRTWVVMNSPKVLHEQAAQVLPVTHKNTCFGIESIQLLSKNTEAVAQTWGTLMNRKVSGLHWNELATTQGKRIQGGDKFLDIIHFNKDALGRESNYREGVCMLTLRVADLEKAKALAVKAGAKPVQCATRDGFIIQNEFTGGPALRFVRQFWKRYLPTINDNFPQGRRKDQFRPLGGAHTSTLEPGFEDDWKIWA